MIGQKIIYCVLLLVVSAGVVQAQPAFMKDGNGAAAFPLKSNDQEYGSEVQTYDFHMAFFAGVSIPLGKFRENSDAESGYSITGWTAGVDGAVTLDPHVDWISTLDLSVNRADMSSLETAPNIHVTTTSWSNVWLLTGLKLNGPITKGSPFKLFALGQVGILFGTSPQINLDWGSGYLNQSSSSSQSLGYSVGAGIGTDNFSICIRYIGGTAGYHITTTGSGGTVGENVDQQTSCIEFVAGIGF